MKQEQLIEVIMFGNQAFAWLDCLICRETWRKFLYRSIKYNRPGILELDSKFIFPILDDGKKEYKVPVEFNRVFSENIEHLIVNF